MSGKTLLDQIDDLSEDDADFVPPDKSQRTSKRHRSRSPNSDTSSSSSEDQEAHPSKRNKTLPEDDTERQRKEEQAKRDLQAILGVEEEAKREREAGLQVRNNDELVKIQRPRFFAGETIYETVRLPKTHPDVAKYGTSSDTSPDAQPGTIEHPSTSNQTGESIDIKTPPIPSTTIPTDSTTIPSGNTTTDAPPRRPPPMRRKPRQSLEAMNAALLAASKGKKMSMTEKSAHDWSAHTASNTALADQLAANRRENGGGFLEKEAFLGRVEERREGLLDRAKGRSR